MENRARDDASEIATDRRSETNTVRKSTMVLVSQLWRAFCLHATLQVGWCCKEVCYLQDSQKCICVPDNEEDPFEPEEIFSASAHLGALVHRHSPFM